MWKGALEAITVQKGITASGVGSDAVHVAGEVPGLDQVPVTAPHGQTISHADRPT